MRLADRRWPTALLAPFLVAPLLLSGQPASEGFPIGLAAAPALSVRSVSPAPGTTEVSSGTAVLVAFDRPVVPLVGAGERQPPSPLVGQPPLSGSGRWVTSSIYALQTQDLHAATLYTVHIQAGLRAVDGSRLAQTYTWQFATVRPVVQDVAPGDGYLYAVPRPSVSLTFNQRMDRASTQAAFHLRDARNRQIGGSFSWPEPGVMRFQPDQPLARTATYSAYLDAGARSAEGPLPLLHTTGWRFSIAGYLHITGSAPRDGESAADLSNGVEVDFSAPVDERSAIDAVRISPDIPERSISFGEDDLSLRIGGSFQPSTAYTVSIKAGLLARAGDRLTAPYGFRFVSAPLAPQIAFVTGGVASYDAYRPLILSLQMLNPGTVTYTVYRLDRDSFVAALDNQYDLANRVPPSGDRVLALRQQPAAPLNRMVPVQVTLSLPGGRTLPPGFYFVQAAGAGQALDYQLLLVSRTNLTLKVSQRQLLVWATDLRSGQPVAGLPLSIIARPRSGFVPERPTPGAGGAGSIDGSRVLAGGRTGPDGSLLLNVPGIGAEQSLVDAGILALAQTPGDTVAATSDWNNGIAPYDYGIPLASYQPPRRLALYTDRPIYRPGQQVHVRGLVRADDDGRFSVVSGPVGLLLSDPKGQVVARQTVTLDRFGAFAATFTLAGNASLGGYSLGAASGDQGGNTGFQVAEYRKPTFIVGVTTRRATYTVGETIEATVGVQYYFGGPVAGARVHWSILGYTYVFYSPLYTDFAFGAYDPASVQQGPGAYSPYRPYPTQGGYTLLQGDGVTDAAGLLYLRLPARVPTGQTVQSYSLEANVTDLDNQPVAGSTGVVVYSSAFQIGLQPEKQVIDPGVAQRIRIVTVDDSGSSPSPDQAVTVAIYRRTYSNQVIHNKDGSVTQAYVPHDTLLSTRSVRTDSKGQAAISFSAPGGGEYHLVASGRDRYGNHTESATEIYAGGEKPIDWGFQQQGHIRLVTDKRVYHSGDVAHVLITAPFPGMLALISIERGHILSYQVRRLQGTATTLALPVPSSYLPDTYVGVIVERGAETGGPPPVWRMGYADIHVDPTERQIRLAVMPQQSTVHPGQPLSLRIKATDHEGHPVQAQLSLSVVDAAALALAGDSGTGIDLLGAFYGSRELGVVTADTLNISPEQLLTKRSTPPLHARALSADSSAVPAPAPTTAAGGAPAAAQRAAPGGGPAITVRKSFADTAYWNAAVQTDAAGMATLVVPLPDNLTTWRILGQAITTDTLVGAGTGDVVATKDLLLRPLLPRFFALGDQALVGSTINNTTATARTVRLRFLVVDGPAGLVPALSGERTIRLAPHAEQDVTWPVRMVALGLATVQVQAFDVEHPETNDAVQLTLPVQENSTPEEVATAGEAGAGTREVVRIPADIEPNEGSLSVTLEPTLAAGLRIGADFLRQYPYDSSIDLASRVLGEAELGRLPERAAVLSAAERSALAPQIGHYLAQLYPMQHGDGGFGWWIDDPYSSPYITVIVVEDLTVARDLGYPVDGTVLSNAAAYLLSNTRSPAATNAGVDYDANLQAEIVYALTRLGQGAAVGTLGAQLFEVRYLLDLYARADLAVALLAQHTGDDDARVRTLRADITGAAKLSGSSTHWDESGYDWRALDSDIAGTAIILDALLVTDPHSPLIPSAVRWLMAARKANAWESTQATAASLQALVDYIMASGELNGRYRYSVGLDGRPWGTGSVDATNLARSRTLTQPLGPQAPAGSSQQLTIDREVRPNNGQLHYVIRLQYYRPVDHIGALGQGVGVTRRYLTPDGSSAALGSTVRVQLTVTAPQDLFYLTLEDPLPAGAESVDTSLRTTTQLAQIEGQSTIPRGTQDLTWYVTHTDLRDNRTVLFLDFLPAGTYQYTYLIHCSTRGVFHTLPTHIQQAYFPEVFGRSVGSYFRVR